jgi:hypothetical protein
MLVKDWPALQVLKLNHTSIGPKGAAILALAKCPSLMTVDLSRN